MSGFESQFTRHYAQIAQSVEQGTENPCVRGSIPRLGTIRIAKNVIYSANQYLCWNALFSFIYGILRFYSVLICFYLFQYIKNLLATYWQLIGNYSNKLIYL